MLVCEVLDLAKGFDLAESGAEWFGSWEAFAVCHESGAHCHDGVFFLSSVSGALDGERAVSYDEFPAFFHGYGRELFAGF